MDIKEFLPISRVVIATSLMITSVYGFIHNLDNWEIILIVAFLIFPNQITVDFREEKDGNN